MKSIIFTTIGFLLSVQVAFAATPVPSQYQLISNPTIQGIIVSGSTTVSQLSASTSPIVNNLFATGTVTTNNLTVTGTCTGCGGGSGTNYWVSSGSNLYPNIGSNTESPTFQATSSTASIFPYASTTALTVSGASYLNGAVTTGLINGQTISSSANFTGTVGINSTISNPTTGNNSFSGSITATGVTSSGAVVANSSAGFFNNTYLVNAANPIWAFQNANTYGMFYYQDNGAHPIGVSGDAIGFAFGTVLSPPFYVKSNGGGYFGSDSIVNGTLQATYYHATSNTASTFPYASTTALTASGSAYFATAGGNVGIGTTSPYKLLSIKDTSNGNTAQLTVADSGGSAAHGYIGNFSNALYLSAGGTYSSGWVSDNPNQAIVDMALNSTNGSSFIGFNTSPSNATAPAEAMRITGSGFVGIGTTSPAATLGVQGNALFSGNITATNITATGAAYTSGGGSGGVGTNPYATTNYVQSRGQNLITNSSGLLGNNYNFSAFTFDSTDTYSGGGSFKINVAQSAATNDELIPVDPTQTYTLSAWGKSGDVGGGNFDAANSQYLGIVPIDIDGNSIQPYMYSKYSGSTDTTLASTLHNGDTTMSLTSATGWFNGSGTPYTRNIVWYPYTNNEGYSYPNYTYSRNASVNYSSYGSLGLWAAGGISGTTVTLTAPWAGPTLAAGTAVRNNTSGGTYKYISASAVAIPNSWTNYNGYIGGLDVNGTQALNLFPYGTAYVKVLFLINYQGSADNNVRWNDVSFSQTSFQNLITSGTINGQTITSAANFTGTLTTAGTITSTAGGGYFAGNVSVGSAGSPTVGRLEIDGTGTGLTSGAILGLNESGTRSWYIGAGRSVSGKLTIGSGSGGDAMTIDGSGNVGIGTTSPTNLLTVAGTANFGVNGAFKIKDNGANNFALGGPNAVVTSMDSVYFLVRDPTGATPYERFGYGGGLVIGSAYGNVPVDAGDGNLFVSNKVGIGTTSPSQVLSVQGNGLFSGNVSLANLTATGTISAPALSLTGTAINSILSTNASGAVVATSSPTANFFTATSTFASQFPYASTTALTVSGTGYFGAGSQSAPSVALTGPVGLYSTGGTLVASVNNNDSLMTWTNFAGISQVKVGANVKYTWTANNDNSNATVDTGFSRGAADVVYVGNGTSGDYSGTLIDAISGIGTSTPSSLFQLGVQGNGLFSGNVSLANLTATGTIGIASSTPGNSSVLGVTGNGMFSGTLYANNFFDTSVSGNTCIGESGGLIGTSNCVSSLASSGGTITVSSPTGAVNVDLALSHGNHWTTATQNFDYSTSTQHTQLGPFYDGSNSAGSTGQVYTSNGANTAPTWQTAGGGGSTPYMFASTSVPDGVLNYTMSSTTSIASNGSIQFYFRCDQNGGQTRELIAHTSQGSTTLDQFSGSGSPNQSTFLQGTYIATTSVGTVKFSMTDGSGIVLDSSSCLAGNAWISFGGIRIPN